MVEIQKGEEYRIAALKPGEKLFCQTFILAVLVSELGALCVLSRQSAGSRCTPSMFWF
jgi:hypothetical protein